MADGPKSRAPMTGSSPGRRFRLTRSALAVQTSTFAGGPLRDAGDRPWHAAQSIRQDSSAQFGFTESTLVQTRMLVSRTIPCRTRAGRRRGGSSCSVLRGSVRALRPRPRAHRPWTEDRGVDTDHPLHLAHRVVPDDRSAQRGRRRHLRSHPPRPPARSPRERPDLHFDPADGRLFEITLLP